MIPFAATSTPTLHALVVEPNETVRRMLSEMLRERGCEVLDCGDLAQARQLFHAQRLLFTPLNGDNSRMKEFVAWVRARAGASQPWIIALGAEHSPLPGETPGDYGVNDVIAGPVEIAKLVARLETLGLGKSRSAAVSSPPSAPAPIVLPPVDRLSPWNRAGCEVLLETFPAAVAIVDRRLNYLCANRQWLRDFQLGDLPVIGRNHLEVFPELHPGWRDLYDHCLNGHSQQSEDDLTLRPDGTREWVRWEIHPWRENGKDVGGLVLTCAVIKTEKHSQIAGNQEIENDFTQQQSVTDSPVSGPTAPMVELDSDGIVVYANPAAAALAGGRATLGEFYWESFAATSHREAVKHQVSALLRQASLAEGTWHSQDMEKVSDREDSAATAILWSSFPRRTENGEIQGIVRIGQPCSATAPLPAAPLPVVTVVAKATAPVPAPKAEPDPAFRQMAEAAPFGMILLNEDAEVLYANPQHRSVLGFSVEECGGMEPWLGRGCAADEDYRKRAVAEWWERVWRRHAPWTCSMRNADGLLKEVEFRPASLPGHRLLLTVFDVTDARLEEQAMRASEARYRGLFQQCAAAVVILNSSGNIIEINPVFERLTGASRLSLRRSTLADFLPEEAVKRVRQSAATGVVTQPSVEFPTTLTGHDGAAVMVSLSVAVVKNEQGHTAFTACHLHPIPVAGEPAAPTKPGLAAPRDATAGVSPDLLLVLDDTGIIRSHKIGRDFASINVQKSEISGQLFEDVFPLLSAPVPLDVMMEQLLDHPAAEVRCDFSAPLREDGEEDEPRDYEARMIRMAGKDGEDGNLFGFIIRDVTAVTTDARTPKPESPALVEVTAVKGPADPADGDGSAVSALLRHARTAAVVTDDRGRIRFLNPAASALIGHSGEDLAGQGLYRIFRPEDPEGFSAELSRRLREERRWCDITPVTRADGSVASCEIDLSPTVDEATGRRGFVALLRPHIPPPSSPKASVSLHRARNDLQVLSSLLALQPDSPASAGRDRVAAMALLYRLISSETDPIDFSRFSRELARLLLENRHISPAHLAVETCFPETKLPQRAAVPLGLILQELLCARLNGPVLETGEVSRVSISLSVADGIGTLSVTGRGTANPAVELDPVKAPGGKILELLAERIQGAYSTTENGETRVDLKFRSHG